jgi:hypothetical protein
MANQRDILTSAAQLTLLVFFGSVGSMHLLSRGGLAPVSFTKFEQDASIALSKLPYISNANIPVNPLWGALQLAVAFSLFSSAKRAAILLGLVTVLAQVASRLGVSAAGNTPAPVVLAVHAILLALALYVYRNGEPLLPLLKRTAASLTGTSPRSPRATNNPYASRNRAKKD